MPDNEAMQQEPNTENASPTDERFVALCRAIEAADELPPLRELARISGLSISHVQRSFKAAIGVSPKAYAQAIKRERFRAALKVSASATHALYEAGISSPSQAYGRAAPLLGMTPGQFAAGAERVRIAYTVVNSALGYVLIAAGERGVCRVDIGSNAAELVRVLHAEFPKAAITEQPADLMSTASLIVDYAAGRGPWPQLPLDVRGTAFQTRVWEALRAVAPGSRVPYGELARIIGSPGSARAVARACAANSIALLIPCHRIVPQRGGTGGYRWHKDRKELLLELEARQTRK